MPTDDSARTCSFTGRPVPFRGCVEHRLDIRRPRSALASAAAWRRVPYGKPGHLVHITPRSFTGSRRAQFAVDCKVEPGRVPVRARITSQTARHNRPANHGPPGLSGAGVDQRLTLDTPDLHLSSLVSGYAGRCDRRARVQERKLLPRKLVSGRSLCYPYLVGEA